MEKITAEEIVKRLADWSTRYPRSRVYGYGTQPKMDGELIEIEEMAKAYIPQFHPTEDIDKWIEEEAVKYVARQGSHETPHITKHDFIMGATIINQLLQSRLSEKEGEIERMKKELEEREKEYSSLYAAYYDMGLKVDKAQKELERLFEKHGSEQTHEIIQQLKLNSPSIKP